MSQPVLFDVAEDAIGIQVAHAQDAQRIADLLRATGEWIDVVPGLDSVTLCFDPEKVGVETARQHLCDASVSTSAASVQDLPLMTIPVRYGGRDGPDLETVSAALGMSVLDFIARHTEAEHCVEITGFTPGFAYVSGSGEALSVPRLPTPRSRLPAGSDRRRNRDRYRCARRRWPR